MKKLYFRYEMELLFEEPVQNHSFCLRCLPSSVGIQQIYSINCGVAPDVNLMYNTDCFGNKTCAGTIEQAHTCFGFYIEGIAFVDHKRTKKERCHPIYCYATELTRTDEELKRFCNMYDPEEKTVLERAIALMNALYCNFYYQQGATNVSTDAVTAFANHTGVCQDYSHILLALLRYHRIPSRYVAGLMVGEGVTHAWIEIYLDGCWIGLDPTHNRLTDSTYLKFSNGRDYRDCMPNRGVFAGKTKQNQRINAVVEERA